jgi:radical SAM superfamily enzyme YgiQ (UPF0313 family)
VSYKYDVTLVHCPNPVLDNPKMYFGLGILYVAAALEKAGYKVAIADLRDKGVNIDLDLIPKAKYIGFSFTTGESTDAKLLAQLVKARDRQCTTIAGGPHPTIMPQDCQDFDIIVRGEGENFTLSPFKRTVSMSRITNLDSVPFPARHLADCFSETLLPGERYGKGQKSTTVIFSRGCPFNCGYCSNILTKPVVYRSPENIAKEIEELISKYNCRSFRIEDDNFTAKKDWMLEVCKKLAPLKVTFKCHSRGELIDESSVLALKEAGCVEMGMGLETADETVLSIADKGTKPADCERAIQLLKKHGIATKVYFVVHLPGETDKTIELNKTFMKRAQPDKWTVSRFCPFPGCPMHDHPSAYGITWIDRDLSHYWNFWPNALVKYANTSIEKLNQRYHEFYDWLRREEWKI